MSEAAHRFISIDLLPLLAATLAALSCGLLGNFLVLRRLSLMGDAISHAVLPGLVAGFLLTGERVGLAMFLGAAGAGIATVILVELVRRLGRVESGAAMGVVFSVMFALGVLLIEQAAARRVDLDPDCVLHGQLEMLFWFPPADWATFFSVETLALVPRQVYTLLGVAGASILFVSLLFKELRIASFDPALATSQGFRAGLLHALLMVLVAAATVAAFEATGSILVVAMLICPAATARLLTDRLGSQVLVSAAAALLCGLLGYVLGAFVPERIGLPSAVNVAGMMSVVGGLLLGSAVFFSPSHGILSRAIRRRRLAAQVAMEDLLGSLFRAREAGETVVSETRLAAMLIDRARPERVVGIAVRAGLVQVDSQGIALTPSGIAAAADTIRRHRLWETYLVDEAGLRADHVHVVAEQLEHVHDVQAQPALDPGRSTDPHGKRIPR